MPSSSSSSSSSSDSKSIIHRSRTLYNEGLFLWKEGKLMEAINPLIESLNHDRYLVIAHLLLAKIKEDLSDFQGSIKSLMAGIGGMRSNSKIDYTQIGLPETIYLADILLHLARLFYREGQSGETIHSLLLSFPHKQLPRHHLLIDEALRNPTETLTDEMKNSLEREEHLFKNEFEQPSPSPTLQKQNNPSFKKNSHIFKIAFTDTKKPKRILQWENSLRDPNLLPTLKRKSNHNFLYYMDEEGDLISLTDPEDLPILFGFNEQHQQQHQQQSHQQIVIHLLAKDE